MSAVLDRLSLTTLLRPSPRFLRFFAGSAGGLAVDLGGFALLTWGGLAPGLANLASSFLSISVVYALVTRYAFGVGATRRTYVLFLAWYSSSIITFSLLIEAAVLLTGAAPLLCKVLSVPVSFLLNYWFSGRLFRTRKATTPATRLIVGAPGAALGPAAGENVR